VFEHSAISGYQNLTDIKRMASMSPSRDHPHRTTSTKWKQHNYLPLWTRRVESRARANSESVNVASDAFSEVGVSLSPAECCCSCCCCGCWYWCWCCCLVLSLLLLPAETHTLTLICCLLNVCACAALVRECSVLLRTLVWAWMLLQFVYAPADCCCVILVEQPERKNPLWRTNLDVTTKMK